MTIRLCKTLLPLAALALAGSLGLAQTPAAPAPASPAAAPAQPPAPGARRPPMGYRNRGMQSGQGMRPGMQHRPYSRAGMKRRGSPRSFHGGPGGGFGGGPRGGAAMGGGFHIAPAGMWWKNPGIVSKLTLTAEQTKKMDDIFQQSRIQLIDLRANVQKQEVMLEPMLAANPPDTAKTLAQIDKVAQARAELEKADAKMLLGIRGVLTPEQWTKLQSHDGPGAPGPGAPGAAGTPGQGGPGGGGPGGPGGGRGRGPRGGGGGAAPAGGEDFFAPDMQP